MESGQLPRDFWEHTPGEIAAVIFAFHERLQNSARNIMAGSWWTAHLARVAVFDPEHFPNLKDFLAPPDGDSGDDPPPDPEEIERLSKAEASANAKAWGAWIDHANARAAGKRKG